ncbi:MAG: Crp/Fnr family transcriptional regulator [Arcicella sp.]|nr:Crp/Fnr family transcriptional regulator [Arcicella sp.]
MNLEINYLYLRNHKMFDLISTQTLREIAIKSNLKSMSKGSVLDICFGEDECVYILMQGMLKIIEIDDDGNEIIKELAHKGDIFGEISLSQSINPCEFGIALSENVIYCSFTMKDFEQILIENPATGIAYSKILGTRLKRIQNRYLNLRFNDVRTRLIYYLEDLVRKEGKTKYNGLMVRNYLTHQDIASLISSTRQTVSQLFNELRKDGLIDYDRSMVLWKGAAS